MSAAVPTQNRIGAEPARESTAAARLALAEILLFSDDLLECARATVDWLADRGGARKAICALIQGDSRTLQHVAASGVPEGQLESLHLALGEPDHPILLTDPEGRMIISNARADALFSAREGESEGRHRAVTLNNMLFSATLSQQAIDESGAARRELLLVSPSEGSDLLFELLSSVVQHPREGTCVVSILRNVTDLRAATEQIEENYRRLKMAEADVRAERDRLDLIIEAAAGKVLSEHGEVTAVVTILHDRTEAIEKGRLYEQLKTASEQLEEKVREATAELVRRNELLQRQHLALEQASQLKSQFLANMSHEFRTPLNAILGYTSMLLQGVSGDMLPPQRNKMMRVDSNARHLLSIINDILDISRIEAGKMPLHVEEFELPALIGELLSEVEPLIQKAKLQVVIEVPQPAPEIQSDRQKVKQIVLNLLTNAIKFTPQGQVRVRLRADDDTRELRIAVEDTGIGIAQEDHDKVFEDFRQADSSVTREYGGAGLGLAICRRLAKMLDGRIELQSRPGGGSTFTLVIPRRGRRR